jgi:hypothetical protein
MEHREIRKLILETLYRYQEANPRSWGLSKRELEEKLGGGISIDFDLWFLEEKGFLKETNGRFKLTVAGIEEVEGWIRKI